MTTDAAAFGVALAALRFGSPVDMSKFDPATCCSQLGVIGPIGKRSLGLTPGDIESLFAPLAAPQALRTTSSSNAQNNFNPSRVNNNAGANYGNSTYAAVEPTLQVGALSLYTCSITNPLDSQPYVCERGFAGPSDCGAAFSYIE